MWKLGSVLSGCSELGESCRLRRLLARLTGNWGVTNVCSVHWHLKITHFTTKGHFHTFFERPQMFQKLDVCRSCLAQSAPPSTCLFVHFPVDWFTPPPSPPGHLVPETVPSISATSWEPRTLTDADHHDQWSLINDHADRETGRQVGKQTDRDCQPACLSACLLFSASCWFMVAYDIISGVTV